MEFIIIKYQIDMFVLGRIILIKYKKNPLDGFKNFLIYTHFWIQLKFIKVLTIRFLLICKIDSALNLSIRACVQKTHRSETCVRK